MRTGLLPFLVAVLLIFATACAGAEPSGSDALEGSVPPPAPPITEPLNPDPPPAVPAPAEGETAAAPSPAPAPTVDPAPAPAPPTDPAPAPPQGGAATPISTAAALPDDREFAFQPGATAGSAHTTLDDDGQARVTFNAGVGQVATVSVTADVDPVPLTIELRTAGATDGLQPTLGAPLGPFWHGALPITGAYELVIDGPAGTVVYANLSIPVAGEEQPFESLGVVEAGSLTLEVYSPVDSPGSYDNIGVVSRNGVPVTALPHAMTDSEAIDPDGDGVTDLLVRTYSGGLHCCWTTHLFSGDGTAEAPRFTTYGGNCYGVFDDVDGDGIAEWLTCDDSFAYSFCSYVASPRPLAVLAFDGSTWVPASTSFPELYEDAQELAAEGLEARGTPDEFADCAVLDVVLNHLYAGDSRAAYEAAQTIAPAGRGEFFWAQIVATARGSRYGTDLDLAVGEPPDYWVPNLHPHCAPGIDRVRITWTLPGETGECGPAVTEISDLVWRLRGTPVLGIGEWGQATCDGTGCFIAVAADSGQPVGSAGTLEIDPDTGTIRRLDRAGVVVGEVRVSGDLTIESIG